MKGAWCRSIAIGLNPMRVSPKSWLLIATGTVKSTRSPDMSRID